MDVPLFPAPPTLKGAPSPLSDVVDVAKLTRDPVVTLACPGRRHGPKGHRRTSPGIHRIRRSVRKNLVHPKPRDRFRHRITEFRITMTERDHNDDDDDDVVCAIDTPTTVSEEFSSSRVASVELKKSVNTVAIQTVIGLPLRLRALPSIKDIGEEETPTSPSGKKCQKVWKHLRFLGRLSLSLFGLTWLLTIWAVVGAAAFCASEGPREREQVVKLKNMQRTLAVSLATELRQIRTEKDEDVEPVWAKKVQKYLLDHEEVLLLAVSAGYGENGNSGQLWTFPGCILFAISILTTLGFGAPVPRTTLGRTITLIFGAIGVPAHFLLVMNLGLIIALRFQRYVIHRRNINYEREDVKYSLTVPLWVKIGPFVVLAVYYVMGILCFGVARSRPFAASILFPLDFTAAGGLSTIHGYVRILYGFFLEGAVLITAVALALLRVTATQSLTHIGLKYGLLIPA